MINFGPRPHYTVFKPKRYCFVPDTAIVHTTTPKTSSENGSFLKRSAVWNDLKTVPFKNAVLLVWTEKTILSENDDVTTTTPLNREYTRQQTETLSDRFLVDCCDFQSFDALGSSFNPVGTIFDF